MTSKLLFEKEVGPENYFVVVSRDGLKKRYLGLEM
jgi:hypothetical protein